MTTLLINPSIYTADESRQFIPKGAILVDGSRIAWIGSVEEWEVLLPGAMPAPGQVRDLSGLVVLPGLINAHAHGGLSLCRGVEDQGDLFSWATSISPYTSHLTDAELRDGCLLAVMEQVRSGTTCTCDCTRFGTTIFAETASKVGLRSLSGALTNSPELRKAGRPNWPSALDETLSAIEEYGSDGLARFYLGAHSPYRCTPELLQEVKAQARQHGLLFNIHVAETQTEVEQIRQAYGQTPVRWLDSLGILDDQTLIDHCIWVDEEEMDILARRGTAVAHCPVSNAKLGSGVAPVPALLEQGIPVGIGTDSMVSNNGQDLFQEMKFAVLMQRAHHANGDLLTARDALYMATRMGARALGLEQEIGSLEVGKKADLMALRLLPPTQLTPEHIESEVVFTAQRDQLQFVMVDGRVIYEQSRFAVGNMQEIYQEIDERYSRNQA